MRTKVKAFIVVVGVLLVVTAISLIIISRGSLYGQPGGGSWIPDLIGEWAGEGTAYLYDDVTALPEQRTLTYASGVDFSDEGNVIITEQTGRVFAGTYEGIAGTLTGVILQDGTVSIQFFERDENRMFFTGKIRRSRGTLQLEGYVHVFGDFHHIHWPFEDEEGARNMATGYGRLTKQD